MKSRNILFLPLLGLFLTGVFVYYSPQDTNAQVAVYATRETTPVLNPPDSADDIAIWIHPTDSSLSTIIGTDKDGNLEVYDLSGAVLQRIPFKTNNVDLRYNFPLNGERVALVTGIDRTAHRIFAYKVNPETRLLEDVTSPQPYLTGLIGSAMYVSPVTGKYYIFTNYENVLRQYELSDNGSGQVAVNLVRTVTFGSFINLTEGVVVDDVYGKVYVSEELVAIWKLGAEPGDGENKVLVDKPLAAGGYFQPDIEGLTIYYKSDGTGYLIGSSQGNGTYTVYTRERNNEYAGTFTIADGIVDKVTGTDGIEVTNFPLGPDFPYGVFIAQDGRNKDGDVSLNQNFKLVPFEGIAGAVNLTMDTSWDPRLVGVGATPPPDGSPTPTPSPTPVTSVLTFTPTDDAYVNANNPNKNFGTVTTLQADASPAKNFYLKFNVSGVSGSQVLSAKLRLYNTNASDSGGDLMFVPDNNWVQSAINWNNAPSAGGSIISSLGKVAVNNWYEFDMTSLITGDGFYTVRVNSSSTNGAAYYAKEGTAELRPALVVTLAQ
ncbi:MAG: 3-phytase (Myo-inositol-hexaphosphate 3-phosphohydrolase) [Candidatus Roizmanbacteria bacterium GW2011_GWB1_40_7]|uniref:3-phytase (Myo-inositol-hexaphosphate 3-phosphohydrolase) n=1 Tax=Candidatus Roizmanbacteria bacterium GW2011_GWB1_40_7 TaxID=1618482 RepID=A0A0G0W720_9BACT|nr:MAG: 3-phytase (Myo-inositol-hexaphosphate 3-phosphohydrolase) [Candidatus Roizmanbacteria bacterium GW2011_GWB1_40_7]